MATHRLDTLCDALGATYSITRDANLPIVRITLALASGDAVSGEAPTTIEAIDALIAKCRKFDLLSPEVTL
jgi:hypothetical protein